MTFTDQLRQAIVRSGKTRYQLSCETGIDQAVLSKFASGKCGLSMASIDALCEAVGAELLMKAEQKTRKRNAKKPKRK